MSKVNKCKSLADSTGRRCKNTCLVGSRYCVKHQSWRVLVIGGGILGVVLTALLNESLEMLIASFFEKKPAINLYLNSRKIDALECVYVLPTPKTGNYPLQIAIKNSGNQSATDAQVVLYTLNDLNKLVKVSGWAIQPVIPSVGRFDTNGVLLVDRFRGVLSPGNAYVCGKFELQQGPEFAVQLLYLEIQTSAAGVVGKRYKIHLACDAKLGEERVVTGREARSLLAKYRVPHGNGQVNVLALPGNNETNEPWARISDPRRRTIRSVPKTVPEPIPASTGEQGSKGAGRAK